MQTQDRPLMNSYFRYEYMRKYIHVYTYICEGISHELQHLYILAMFCVFHTMVLPCVISEKDCECTYNVKNEDLWDSITVCLSKFFNFPRLKCHK